jgi:glycine oxidase
MSQVHTPNKNQSYDAIIAGAGVIGLSCAWRAARDGAKVAVVDRADPASAATHVAAGMLAPVGELDFGEGGLLELTTAAAELYPRFVGELEGSTGINIGYSRCGGLHVALDRDEAAELRRIHDLQRSLGLESEWLPTRECRRLEPGLPPSFHGGVHVAGDASVDPRALSQALLAAIAAEGVRIMAGVEIERALLANRRIEGLVTDRGELRAEAVVLATGAWSGQAPWLPPEARPPVRPVKGQILELAGAGAEPVCKRIVASERVYLVPRSDGRLIVGATVEEKGFDTTVTAGGVYELLREAHRLLPDVAELELLAATAGLRPGTPDNLPLIGPGELNGLVLATGHHRNGILLAPLTAERVSRLLSGAGVAA